MDGFNTFSFFVVKSWFLAIHGWLSGAFLKELAAKTAAFFLFDYLKRRL
jgi:hypothetical protein